MVVMIIDFLKNAKRLPVIDWNLTFFGAHEQAVTKTWAVPIEKHYAFECIYVLSGKETIIMHHMDFTLNSGDFFIVPPEFLHRVRAESDLKYFCYHFDIDDPRLKAQLIQGLDYYHPVGSAINKAITPHLLKLDALVQDSTFDFTTKMIIQIELSHILMHFYEASQNNATQGSSTQNEYARTIADYLKNDLTSQVLAYLKEGYTTDQTKPAVEAAIDHVGLSKGYGFRIFKETYGISPREYLSKLKVNEAKKLLLKPGYAILDISSALGYSGISNFSRQFKRWTNISPNEFRKQQLNK
ncbi:transcriptional regulator, AraC family [Agrilactobacillus composti DSM 18527 = JCM 14202]|uniref:Transcriptional regulator, AraC family n=2 Tax=Agrilactobacillus TaxID=2767875 RepID=A0A0R1XL06_9LACO|nr:transcriptional regulator, AraC family [Agrilactobacillus composti DSM 18527 = JCM 14202]